MRLMIMDEGPARLSRFSNAQAVGRDTPRAMDCLAAVSKPAATNASRISASFEACLAFARRFTLLCRMAYPGPVNTGLHFD